jgi:hypothetical protein
MLLILVFNFLGPWWPRGWCAHARWGCGGFSSGPWLASKDRNWKRPALIPAPERRWLGEGYQHRGAVVPNTNQCVASHTTVWGDINCIARSWNCYGIIRFTSCREDSPQANLNVYLSKRELSDSTLFLRNQYRENRIHFFRKRFTSREGG